MTIKETLETIGVIVGLIVLGVLFMVVVITWVEPILSKSIGFLGINVCGLLFIYILVALVIIKIGVIKRI